MVTIKNFAGSYWLKQCLACNKLFGNCKRCKLECPLNIIDRVARVVSISWGGELLVKQLVIITVLFYISRFRMFGFVLHVVFNNIYNNNYNIY